MAFTGRKRRQPSEPTYISALVRNRIALSQQLDAPDTNSSNTEGATIRPSAAPIFAALKYRTCSDHRPSEKQTRLRRALAPLGVSG